MGFAKSLDIRTPTPEDTMISDITMKGKSEGITEDAHSESPFFIYSIAASVEQRTKRKDATARTLGMTRLRRCFIFDILNSDACSFLMVIYIFSEVII